MEAKRERQRGGAGRGQGRKPMYGDEPLDDIISMRVTAAQKRAYALLGGNAWLRTQLDAAALDIQPPVK